MRNLPLDREDFRASVGAEPITGDDTALFHERVMLRPAFNVSGFSTGYTGPGIKNMYIGLTLVGWTAYTRLIRGEILVVRKLEYMDAARALDQHVLHRTNAVQHVA